MSPWPPASWRTTSLDIAGRTSSCSPWSRRNGRGARPAAPSQPADCVDSVHTPATAAGRARPTLTATAPPKEWPTATTASGATLGGEVDGGHGVEDARIEVGRPAVVDAHRGHAERGEAHAEVVVQRPPGPEQAAHPARTGDDELLGVGRAVPEQPDEAAQGVDLAVAQAGRDRHLLHPQRGDQLRRPSHDATMVGPGQAAVSSLKTRRAFSRRNFGQTSSLNGTLGMSRNWRSSVRPAGK